MVLSLMMPTDCGLEFFSVVTGLCACALVRCLGSTYFGPEQSIASTKSAWMPGDYCLAFDSQFGWINISPIVALFFFWD